MVDWCCFYYFTRNSLATLLETLFARILDSCLQNKHLVFGGTHLEAVSCDVVCCKVLECIAVCCFKQLRGKRREGGTFCVDRGCFCGHLGPFFKDIGLFCGNVGILKLSAEGREKGVNDASNTFCRYMGSCLQQLRLFVELCCAFVETQGSIAEI